MSPARPAEKGVALAALILFLTASLILLSSAVPAYRLQGQRELEEELIFRGQEYVRAIQKYQRQFGIFPPSLDALLETNGIPYLRRAYADPITGNQFRLLTINPDGTVNGSMMFSGAGEVPQLFQGGNPQPFPGSGSSDRGSGAQGVGAGQGGGFFQGAAEGASGQAAGQTLNRSPVSSGGGPSNAAGFGAPAAASQGFGGGGSGLGNNPASSGAGNQIVSTGGIVGVAPQNENRSLKAYNQRQIYSQWEFIALPGFGTLPAAQVPGQNSTFGQASPAPFSDTPPNPFD